MNRTNRRVVVRLITAVVFSGLVTAGGSGVPVRLLAAADWAKARDARNMRLVGHTDLNGIGDGGEGLDLRQYPDGRRILFFAHVNAPNCLSTVDVTDPKNPKVLAQVPAVSKVVRCNSLGVVGNTLIIAQNTDEPGQPDGGARIYDVSDPAKPTEIAYFNTSGGPSRGAHSVWFTDGQYAYLSTGAPDFEPAVPPRGDDQFLMIVDVRDRLHPKEIGRWWMPGQRKGEPGAPLPRTKTHDGVRLHSVYWSPERPNRLYAGWIDGGMVILDISDKTKPTLVGQRTWYPKTDGYIAHSIAGILSRNLAVATQETTGTGCEADRNARPNTNQGLQMPMWTVDISDERHPREIAQLPPPRNVEASCKGIKGRYGSHNIHMSRPTPNAAKLTQTVVAAVFAAGVRVYSIADPNKPVEIGFFVPEAPPRSPMGVTQINDVYVDENGLIYAADRNSGGLYILEYTGSPALR
jgi:hypothetical protein